MELTYVTSEDGEWEGLYKDGTLVAEGHTLSLSDVAKAAGFELKLAEVSDEWLSKRASLPLKLKNCKLTPAR